MVRHCRQPSTFRTARMADRQCSSNSIGQLPPAATRTHPWPLVTSPPARIMRPRDSAMRLAAKHRRVVAKNVVTYVKIHDVLRL